MKIRLIVGAAVISMCSASHLSAYIFSFSNHTIDPLKVRVQLAGINEPWEEVYIEPKTTWDFPWVAAGHPRASLNVWKAGFCLQNIQVAEPLKKKKVITAEDGERIVLEEYEKDSSGKIKFGPWANVIPKFIKSEGAQAILNAAKGFAGSLQNLAQDAASAYAQYKAK